MYEHTYSGRDPNLRAADADRDLIAERLRVSHADGRLDADEFQERIDQCYKARTIGELEQLVGDLPPAEPPTSHTGRFRRLPYVPLVPILIALLLISAAAGHHGHFGLWIVIPLFFLARFWRWRRRWWRMPRRSF
jgi:hypothetical protein